MVRESDYVKTPKSNGYRSYHVIVGIPVYCLSFNSSASSSLPLRLPFLYRIRCSILAQKSMDMVRNEELAEELKEYADMLVEIEGRFELHSEGKQVQDV